VQIKPFTENRIRETFHHIFKTMHLLTHQISSVDIDSGVRLIKGLQYHYIDSLEKSDKPENTWDRDFSLWLDSQVKTFIENSIAEIVC
jgi:hypothetical protein